MTTTIDPAALDLPAEAGEPTLDAGRCSGRHRRTLALGLLAGLVGAVVCTTVLEAPLWWGHVNPALVLLSGVGKPLDVLVVLVVLGLLYSVTGRLWLSLGLLLGATAFLSAVNTTKMSILAEPVAPSDAQFLRTPGLLATMVSTRAIAAAAVGLVVLVSGTWAASRYAGRRWPHLRRTDHPRTWAVLLGLRAVTAVTLSLALVSASHFNYPGNHWRRMWEAQGAIWQPFVQEMNYRSNGFVGGLLYNMPADPMPRPADYSARTMAEVAARYTTRAQQRNAGRVPGALDDVNVVLVLSEAFGDLSRLHGIEPSRDTMALTRQTRAEAWGGSTIANLYGGGTSSMEFEALTGQTLGLFNPQVIAPYQNFMTGLSSYPSAVGWFAQHGHDPIAVHPYQKGFYRRDVIYPMLGFQDFVDEKAMSDREKLEHSHYISDEAAFTEVEQQLDDHAQPMLVNLVTMQNHVPTNEWYDDPIPVSTPGSDLDKAALGGYARGQEYTDQALRRFLDHLKASPEPTVVVFYGDHYPAILSDEVLDQNQGLDRLETPMFIWSSQGQSPRALPVTSPANFLPYVFDLVGQPLPPYYELLSEVAEQIGAVAAGRIVAPDGTETTEDQLTPAQQQLLHDYRLVQYDFSIGARYAVDDMWYSFGQEP